MEEADFLLNAGAVLGNPSDTSDYETLLNAAHQLELPMICANPDLVAIRAGKLGISAGTIAERYRQLGASQIQFFGKPFASIYQLALQLLDNPNLETALMVGDSYATDILGANNVGLDSCLIAAGIHQDDLTSLSSASVTQAARGFPSPTYASEYFQW